MRFSSVLSSISVVLGIATARAIENIDNNGYIETVETKNFKYTFSCVEDHNGICNTIRKNLDSALDVLNNTFEFYQPVVFEIYIDDLSVLGLTNTAGVNADTNYVPLRLSNDTNSPPYLFPQSLAKQLNINKELEFNGNDFVIAIDTMKEMEEMPDNAKFDALLLHEITHALGFLSFVDVKRLSCSDEIISIIPDDSIKKEDNIIAKVLPEFSLDLKMFNAETMDELISQAAMSKVKFYPLTIFEKYIVDAQTKDEIFGELGYLYRDFENCFGEDATYMDITHFNYLTCYDKLSSEKKELITSITDNYLTKAESIGFLTNNDNVIPLQTFNNTFLFGSSISHTSYKDSTFFNEEGDFDDTIIPDEEFAYKTYDENILMNFAGDNLPRDLLFKTVDKNNKHGLMGNGIVDILKTMGWTEKGDSKNSNQYYLAEDVEFPEQNKFKFFLAKKTFLEEMPTDPTDEMPSDLTDEIQEVDDSCDIYHNNVDDNTNSDFDYEVSLDNNDHDNTDSDSDFEDEQQ